MRNWVLPFLSLLFAGVVTLVYVTNEGEAVEVANPMCWASDVWEEWEQMTPGVAAKRIPKGTTVPQTRWVRSFMKESGEQVWHADLKWPTLSADWIQQSWRGGWICGTQASLDLWEDIPGEMASRWREGDFGALLCRTKFGWQLEGDGILVWKDNHASCKAVSESMRTRLFVPEGKNTPSSWWCSRLGEVPVGFSEIDVAVCDADVQLSDWGTRWNGGGRWHVLPEWREDVQRLANEKGWSAHWIGDDVVLNGSSTWDWKVVETERAGCTDSSTWIGSLTQNGVVIWASEGTPTSTMVTDLSMGTTADEEGTLGLVRNHRTRMEMTIKMKEGTVVAERADGTPVWTIAQGERLLAGGALEVDVYANGKYQAMFCESSGLHLVDVKGREVSGFPIKPSRGTWTAWALVDYDATRNFRYLLASEFSGLVMNFRGEGEVTTGWKHRPDDGIDVSSTICHLRHLRLGSKDYIYVGRANGQVELLNRSGATRATTPVRVNSQKAPLFRKGKDLKGTSVIFIDGAGWVREFTLGEGEEVGLSGITRADRIEQRDVDGDGLEDVVTWFRGERMFWNARNERIE